MILRKTLILSMFISIHFGIFAQFNITINKQTGAISSIVNFTDPNKMNWILSSSDGNTAWQHQNQDWGMGKFKSDLNKDSIQKWEIPQEANISENSASLLYHTKPLDIKVNRKPEGAYYVETYTLSNNTSQNINISDLQIFTPFNDNYPDARTCATNRCNAHIWTGMHASYVNAMRMNGSGPHLGLILTKGALQSYVVENRNTNKEGGWSNSRGTMALKVENFSLKPGQSYVLQWKIFWHEGWKDFYAKAKNLGFVHVKADKYVTSKGGKIKIETDALKTAKLKHKTILVTGDKPGEYSKKIYFDNGHKYTFVNYLVISSPKELLAKRAHFIVDHQQMNDLNDQRYGAYMVYDNDLNKIVTDPSKSVSSADRNEGAERLGMGIFIARWLQYNTDEKIKESLRRYVKFVRTKLQDTDYKTFSNVTKNSYPRGYNYPWVASLYLDVYKLTGERQYLEDYYGTMRKFFTEYGHHFYGIDMRIKEGIAALASAGMNEQKEVLLNDYKLFGDFIIKNGIYYPKHEVNYEQSIVAPAVTVLCELYLVTKEQKYLTAAKEQMPSLEAFNGKQPDVHLYDIGIRHWDGYWFGKGELLGDTMPHHWSALTGIAFYRYYQCTQESSYAQRAKGIVENNLLNFKEDGKASCAYLYPETVNGKPGKYYDAYANDQDWALAYYLDVMN
ncbi:six-hairpin glycosidase [Sphingobacterium spiritivorum]|uniref:six-hairpin glycosidase n=1 Tax=Sphingobacterium spiritivorum TaxID=258 RepID=UPI003DA67F74